jgi:hypothetical protein
MSDNNPPLEDISVTFTEVRYHRVSFKLSDYEGGSEGMKQRIECLRRRLENPQSLIDEDSLKQTEYVDIDYTIDS